MRARVQSNTLFGGKLYARDSPSSCFVDVGNSMDFSLAILLNGDLCGTKSEVNDAPAGHPFAKRASIEVL